MGNRAVIATEKKDIGIYLHWNGGRDSVEAFLEYCRLKGYRTPENDSYGWSRLAQVIGNFFGGTTSVGIGLYDTLDTDNFDNGVYIIRDWKVVGREFVRGFEQRQYVLKEMLIEINNHQPLEEQINPLFFEAEEVETKNLKVNDKVFVQNHNGEYELFNVVSLSDSVLKDNRIVNGTNVKGLPRIDKYGNGEDNINNYLREKSYRVVK